MRMVSVRETAWLNMTPSVIWETLSEVREWHHWCHQLMDTQVSQEGDLTPGIRFRLYWAQKVPPPLRGGKISMIRNPGGIRIGQIDEVLTVRESSVQPSESNDNSSILREQTDCYQLAWTAGWGPWRSDACITLTADGSGSRAEFMVSWQGWASWLMARNLSACGKFQRSWLADLQVTMERIGSLG